MNLLRQAQTAADKYVEPESPKRQTKTKRQRRAKPIETIDLPGHQQPKAPKKRKAQNAGADVPKRPRTKEQAPLVSETGGEDIDLSHINTDEDEGAADPPNTAGPGKRGTPASSTACVKDLPLQTRSGSPQQPDNGEGKATDTGEATTPPTAKERSESRSGTEVAQGFPAAPAASTTAQPSLRLTDPAGRPKPRPVRTAAQASNKTAASASETTSRVEIDAANHPQSLSHGQSPRSLINAVEPDQLPLSNDVSTGMDLDDQSPFPPSPEFEIEIPDLSRAPSTRKATQNVGNMSLLIHPCSQDNNARLNFTATPTDIASGR